MPYAITGKISKSPIDGGIEITDAEYKQAIDAQMQGKRVVVKDSSLQLLSNDKRTVYSTTDGSELEIFTEEDTPTGYTDAPRPDNYHTWLNGKWTFTELNSYKADCIGGNRTAAGLRISQLFGGKIGDDLRLVQLNGLARYLELLTAGEHPDTNAEMKALFDLNAAKDAIRQAENDASAAINAATDKAGVDAVKEPVWP